MRCQRGADVLRRELGSVVELHVGADLEGVGLAVVGRLGHLGAEIADVLGGRRRIVRRDADQHAVVRRRGMHRGEGRLAMAVEARRRVGRNHVDERSAAFGRLRPRGKRSDRGCEAEARSQKSRTQVHLPPPVQPDFLVLFVTSYAYTDTHPSCRIADLQVRSLPGARHSSGAHGLCDPRRSATEWRAPGKDEDHERTWRSALRQGHI